MTVKVMVSSVDSTEITVELTIGKGAEPVEGAELGPVVRPDEITVCLVLLAVLSGIEALSPEPERVVSVVWFEGTGNNGVRVRETELTNPDEEIVALDGIGNN